MGVSEEFTRCDRCQRTSGLHEAGTQCVRGYQNPPGHEVPRCFGTMVPNRPLEFAPAPQLAHLKHTQTFRLYNRAYERMARGDGYQPWGFDWPTIRLTKPGWYRALKIIIATHNEAARKFREANHKHILPTP